MSGAPCPALHGLAAHENTWGTKIFHAARHSLPFEFKFAGVAPSTRFASVFSEKKSDFRLPNAASTQALIDEARVRRLGATECPRPGSALLTHLERRSPDREPWPTLSVLASAG
jgi:hypothetical protein